MKGPPTTICRLPVKQGADVVALRAITRLLSERGIPHVEGKTWSTDGPYRETRAQIAKRKSEGCVVVDIDAAGMMAVAAFRQVGFGQIVYGGDDLSGAEWDNRDWQNKADVRESLFWLCADAVLSL